MMNDRKARAERDRLVTKYKMRICEPDYALCLAYDHALVQWPALLDFMQRLDASLDTEQGKMIFSSVMRNAIVIYTGHLMDGPAAHWPYERLQGLFRSIETDLNQWAPLLCDSTEESAKARGTGIERALVPQSIASILEAFRDEQIMAADVLRTHS